MADPKPNLGTLCSFARAFGIADEIAIGIYEAEYRRLSSGATIKRYVSVIAEKRAKDALRTGAHTKAA